MANITFVTIRCLATAAVVGGKVIFQGHTRFVRLQDAELAIAQSPESIEIIDPAPASAPAQEVDLTETPPPAPANAQEVDLTETPPPAPANAPEPAAEPTPEPAPAKSSRKR